MDTTDPFKYTFILDEVESIKTLGYALIEATNVLSKNRGLTLTVKNTTLDRTPHGNGLWTYTLKVNPNVN